MPILRMAIKVATRRTSAHRRASIADGGAPAVARKVDLKVQDNQEDL